MNIVGQKVSHRLFGEGIVMSNQGQILTVLFEQSGEVKSFVYPDAFEGFLAAGDPGVGREIQQEISTLRKLESQRREAKRMAALQRQEELRRQAAQLAKQRRKSTRAAPQPESKVS